MCNIQVFWEARTSWVQSTKMALTFCRIMFRRLDLLRHAYSDQYPVGYMHSIPPRALNGNGWNPKRCRFCRFQSACMCGIGVLAKLLLLGTQWRNGVSETARHSSAVTSAFSLLRATMNTFVRYLCRNKQTDRQRDRQTKKKEKHLKNSTHMQSHTRSQSFINVTANMFKHSLSERMIWRVNSGIAFKFTTLHELPSSFDNKNKSDKSLTINFFSVETTFEKT